jgi:membrane protein implicated in regulation of membrane protease activity
MTIEWWHWAVLGIVLITTELALPTMVLIWFGIGALFVAAIHAAAPALGLTLEIAVWIVCSVVSMALWFKVLEPARHKTLIGRASAQIVGEVGMLTSDVAPFQNGKVRFQKPLVGTDLWVCMADEAIKSGARVKVVSVEGSVLKITKAGDIP